MNQKGKEYINKVSLLNKNYKIPASDISESETTERMMRLGIEKHTFNLEGNSDLQKIAVSTILEDLIKRKQYASKQHSNL